jgi:hypothetical protein
MFEASASQNVLLVQETRPLRFLVIQQIAQNNKDSPIKPLKLRMFAFMRNMKPGVHYLKGCGSLYVNLIL